MDVLTEHKVYKVTVDRVADGWVTNKSNDLPAPLLTYLPDVVYYLPSFSGDPRVWNTVSSNTDTVRERPPLYPELESDPFRSNFTRRETGTGEGHNK